MKSVATLKEKNATIADLWGGVIGHSINSLDEIRQNKISTGIEITDSVLKLLKDIDSPRKADHAVSTIRNYLSTTKARIAYVTEERKQIEDLIRDIMKLVDKATGPMEFCQLITDVSSLKKGLEDQK
jgi:hypothetical protein